MEEEHKKLEGGAYEVIRTRLEKQSLDLRGRLEVLNESRKAVFGAIEASPISTERVNTEHNCVPRDLISIGENIFIFGYNIQFGLKKTTEIKDIFAAYNYDNVSHSFQQLDILDVLSSKDFLDDFSYLFKYYKESQFCKMMQIGAHLFMVVQTGKTIEDFKTFKWIIKGDGTLTYVGNRFDHEYRFPEQQEFKWKRCSREMHRSGEYPHISIEDRVFVEAVGGDITIKVEDNTADGAGIYSEAVSDKDQTLDDAEIYYTIVGPLILLKILPYRETEYRYLVYNEKNYSVDRIDSIGNSCVLLPEDHGLIFSNGYYLLSGELKQFDHGLVDMRFERKINSANGEDTLFAFYNRVSGEYVLLTYNLIEQRVETPIICNGYSIFDNGELLYFKTENQAQKHHAIQIWQTPVVSENAIVNKSAKNDSSLYKIGNAEIVMAMAESRELLTLLAKDDSYGGLYVDLMKKSSDILDSYFWINTEDTGNLAEPLTLIHSAAQSAIDEFDKVSELRKSAKDRLKELSEKSAKILLEAQNSLPDDIVGFVEQLAGMRNARGEVIGLRSMRYMDVEAAQALEKQLIDASDIVSKKTVSFLLEEEALKPYKEAVEEHKKSLLKSEKVVKIDMLNEHLNRSGEELEMLIDVVSNLKIEDSTVTTKIIDSITTIYSSLNGVKVELKNKRRDLNKAEGVAQFSSQMTLLSQAVVSYLELSDTSEKTDEYLTKVMVQIEELEGKFSEFDEYVEELTVKREEIYTAFSARKQQLIEKRNKRSNALVKSAERILSGIGNRVASFEEINEINGYFAGDLMIEKIRNIITELKELDDSVKSDDIQTRLKTTQEDAVRALKDKKELFVDGQNIIQFGKNKFNVNTQDLELSIIPQDDEMCFHLRGTDFFEVITDEAFIKTQGVWGQEIISENKEVYRAEYLVYQLLQDYDGGDVSLKDVQSFMQPRYAEAYTKGVHDEDAFKILTALLPIHKGIGLLKFSPKDRALAIVFWQCWKGEKRNEIASKIVSHGKHRTLFEAPFDENHSLISELKEELKGWYLGNKNLQDLGGNIEIAALYLFEELTNDEPFVVSSESADWVKGFKHKLTVKHADSTYLKALEPFEDKPIAAFQVILDWLEGYANTVSTEDKATPEENRLYLVEAAAHLLAGYSERAVKNVRITAEVEGLIGSHSCVKSAGYHLHYNHFIEKIRRFVAKNVPVFEHYQQLKHELLEAKKSVMRLEEFKPKVMSAFVRNRLLNNVYLPLIGDNLAKQLGTAGDDTRTDRMGLLLLISPPGYGKTTIMEYVANRLGLTFMKINGPALGHDVVSLDPAEAPNATAAEEVKKLNLALEMGDNVLIYLDDIQHTNSEFLQKFISLCDGQRKIEGVYNGVTRTYDLRGKKVGVVMAGNPYTETGGKFQIPDMLANRADTYNLGDILGGHAEDFKASYIENSLTSNKVLSKLSSKSQQDVYSVMRIVETGSQEGVDFIGNYSPTEIDEMVKVCKHLYRVRDTILRVNLEYIKSAAQEDAYRVEPAFKLQGSYRNMNRIAEKIIPLMSDKEVAAIILDYYENESQTLTSGAEANLLKFKEMEGFSSVEDAERWQKILEDFNRNILLAGADENDPMSRVVAQMTSFSKGLSAIQKGISDAASSYAQPQTLNATTIEHLESIITSLRAVPVEVDINVMAAESENSGIENIEKTKKVKRAKKAPIKIDPEVRQDTT